MMNSYLNPCLLCSCHSFFSFLGSVTDFDVNFQELLFLFIFVAWFDNLEGKLALNCFYCEVDF